MNLINGFRERKTVCARKANCVPGWQLRLTLAFMATVCLSASTPTARFISCRRCPVDKYSRDEIATMLELFQSQALTVIKVGGSLFDLADLGSRIERFLDLFEIPAPILVPGGGPIADSIRQLDETFRLDSATSHELGVRTLALTARLISELSSRFSHLESHREVNDIWECRQFPIISPIDCILRDSKLPASWDVTSDSIAAWIASQHPRSQLILFKSTDLPSGISFADAAVAGLVDRHFPNLAPHVSQIGWCNLREDQLLLNRWK